MARRSPQDHLVLWAIGGQGWAESGAWRAAVTTGTCVVLPQGLPHRYGSDTERPWDILWVHMLGPWADAWVEAMLSRHGWRVELGTPGRLIDAFHEVVERDHGAEADRALARHLVWGLLGRIEHRLAFAGPRMADERHDAAERVRRYVADHLTQPLAVADLAKAAGVSPRQLTRLCRAAWDASPMAYVTSRRLAHACSLLTETDLPVGRIAEEAGFSDPYHFSHTFRKHIGEPPRDYRRRQRVEVARPRAGGNRLGDRYHDTGQRSGR